MSFISAASRATMPEGAMLPLYLHAARPDAKGAVPPQKKIIRSMTSGQIKTEKNKPTLTKPQANQRVMHDELALGSMSVPDARLVDRSLIEKNVERLRDLASKSGQLAVKAEGKAKTEYSHLLQLLKKHLGNEHSLPLSDELRSEDFLAGNARKDFPKELISALASKSPAIASGDNSQIQSSFESIQGHLQNAHDHRLNAANANQHADLNQTAVETLRHPSLRSLSRVFTPNVRKQMMSWLNIVGLLTMVLTFPLMYEGLKQWAQSLKHPQDAAPQ